MSRNFDVRSEDGARGRLAAERSFGLLLTAAAAVVAVIWRRDGAVLSAALAVATALLAVSLAVPRLLRPLNVACSGLATRLGRLLNRA